MKPEPRVRVIVQCVSKSKVQKGKDGKSNPPSASPACKKGEGDPGPSTRRKLRSDGKKTKQFECFQCFKMIELDILMKHLLDHEMERRAKFYSPTSDEAEAIQEAKQICRLDEIKRRRFLYPNLGDPRRYRDDAILVCPGCREKLYYTMDDFCKHCFSCSKYKELKDRFGLKI